MTANVPIPDWAPAAEMKRLMLVKISRAGFVIQEVSHDYGFRHLWSVYRMSDGKVIASGADCFDAMADACQFIEAQEALSGTEGPRVFTAPQDRVQQFKELVEQFRREHEAKLAKQEFPTKKFWL